jgi:hypothetical protein
MFGQQVVEMISNEDIDRYSLGIVERRESEEDLWYSMLKKYDFDQNTSRFDWNSSEEKRITQATRA